MDSGPLYKELRTSNPQRNVMGQSTEMSLLVSMLLRTFLIPFLIEFFYIYNISIVVRSANVMHLYGR